MRIFNYHKNKKMREKIKIMNEVKEIISYERKTHTSFIELDGI